MDFNDLRTDYGKGIIDERQIPDDPFTWLSIWMKQATKAGITDANAMVLSTVSVDHRPSSRIVLLKSLENGRFIFFTNYNSRKGEELAGNPFASLLFYWSALERQVRIEGIVSKTDESVSDQYFESRPAASRISAIISPQSQRVSSRSELEDRLKSFTEAERDYPRPAYWGGYSLEPSKIEFWQGRPNRLHDRIQFYRESSPWKWCRLAP